MKTYYIETFGCQMNKSDSALIRTKLESSGYVIAPIETASIVIFNTCAVRDNAERRAIARITEAKSFAKQRKQIIITAGCVAQYHGEDLIKRKLAHIAIGPYEFPRIVDIIEEYKRDKKSLYVSQQREDFQERILPLLPVIDKEKPWQQWVTITHGCENFCTYCIVPYVRGPLHSFSSDIILDYLMRMADKGVTEIMLLGQNVNQYGQDSNDIPFYSLLEKCAKITAFKKIGFLTSHPKDFPDSLIKVIRDYDNIAKSVHLPLQSGSDRILKAMNRQYTLSHYMHIVDMLKKTNNVSLSTDLIVGFPGETNEDFEATIKAVQTIQYDEAFMYAYSPRSGTPSADFPEQVENITKKNRLSELISLQRVITLNRLLTQVGSETTVIPESRSKKNDKDLAGRSMHNHPVIFEAPTSLIGHQVSVRIEKVIGATLKGQLIEKTDG